MRHQAQKGFRGIFVGIPQAMRPTVTYTTYAISSKEQTGNVTTFAKFEEGIILTETHNDAESGDEYDNKSVMTS